MTYKIAITGIIGIIFINITYYLNGIIGLLEFILSIILYTLIFFGFHIIWSKIRKKEEMSSAIFIKYFLYRISILLIVFTSLFGGLAYISNEIYPATMPEYTISNGTKIVKFQAMSHIGTQDFYDNVQNNIIKHKLDGGVYFFEGVQPGSKENAEKFNDAIGMEFDENLYKNFSKLYGVVAQDNSLLLGRINNLDFNVDISIDRIIELYEQKIKEKPKSENIKTKLPIDANAVIIETLSQLNNKQLKVLVYINQAILNFIIGSDSTQSFLTNNFANKELFEVILGERNIVIADTIIRTGYDNIYMTYGLLHFRGVFELLQKKDSNWKIVSTKNLYPIKN